MISEDQFGLRPLWDALLIIYVEIAKICMRHNLRFYATDGTALGAIRHKGFIPWDDDFDISMPRPDYDRFLQFAKVELPSNLKIVNYKNTPEFKMLFAKVQETREAHVLAIESNVGNELSNGVFIDIFPIEGFPSSKLARITMKLRNDIIIRMASWIDARFQHGTIKDKMKCILAFIIGLFWPQLKTTKGCLDALEMLYKSVEFEKSEYTARSCSQRTIFRRQPLLKKVWGKPVAAEFDNINIMLPEDSNAYLINEFNKFDYHQLPPEKDRVPTHQYGSRCAWWLGPTT